MFSPLKKKNNRKKLCLFIWGTVTASSVFFSIVLFFGAITSLSIYVDSNLVCAHLVCKHTLFRHNDNCYAQSTQPNRMP